MNGRYRRIEFLEHNCSPLIFEETPPFSFSNKPKKPLKNSSFSSHQSFVEELGFALDLLNPSPTFDLPLPLSFQNPCLFPSPFDIFETITDLIQVQKTPFSSSFTRIQTCPSSYSRKMELEKTVLLESLLYRVSTLELGFEQIIKPAKNTSFSYKEERDSKGGVDRKYIWTAQIKGGKESSTPIEHKYTFKAKTVPVEKKKENAKEKGKEKEKGKIGTRVVEIKGSADQNAIAAFRQKALARKRAAAAKIKGKQTELSPEEAALIIQISFRAYLVRRSQALRGLRELAVAKAKLKELKAYFTNFSYRRRIAADAEECQRFSEKIIVLLLTVDAIEGTDHMIREARRGMVEELEGMLEAVDPQPPGKLGSMKRRRFDLPGNGPIAKEMAVGVAEVVELLNEEESSGGIGYSRAFL